MCNLFFTKLYCVIFNSYISVKYNTMSWGVYETSNIKRWSLLIRVSSIFSTSTVMYL